MTSQVSSTWKISTFAACSHIGGWRLLDSSEWTQVWPSYSQLHTEGTIRVLTLYLVYLKVKARSQEVTIILKSQIGNATHVSWSTLTREINNCVHWVVWNNFQQFIVKVRSRSGQKGHMFNFINVNKKRYYQMQFELKNPMEPFILLCDVRKMLKYTYAFELLTLFHGTLFRIQKNKILVSQLF